MFRDRLVDFSTLLCAKGLAEEAMTLVPKIYQYATELDVSLQSPSSSKRSKTQLVQGVKDAIAQAGNDTPLGVTVKVLRKFMASAGVYGWLGDTSKCFISLGNPNDQGSVNWFFDLGSGEYVGRQSIAVEDKWSQILQRYGVWLKETNKVLQVVSKGKDDQVAKQLQELTGKLTKFLPMVQDIIENYAEDMGVGASDTSFEFDVNDLKNFHESVQYAIEILPAAIKYYQQRSTWVKIAQKTRKRTKPEDLKEYQQKLLGIVERHDPKTSPLAFCWKIAKPYVKTRLLPTQLKDNEKIALAVGKQDAILIFSLNNGALVEALPFDAGDAYIRRRQKELAKKRREEEAVAEDKRRGYDRRPELKMQDIIDQAQRLKREREIEEKQRSEGKEKKDRYLDQGRKKRKYLEIIKERNRKRRDSRR